MTHHVTQSGSPNPYYDPKGDPSSFAQDLALSSLITCPHSHPLQSHGSQSPFHRPAPFFEAGGGGGAVFCLGPPSRHSFLAPPIQGPCLCSPFKNAEFPAASHRRQRAVWRLDMFRNTRLFIKDFLVCFYLKPNIWMEYAKARPHIWVFFPCECLPAEGRPSGDCCCFALYPWVQVQLLQIQQTFVYTSFLQDPLVAGDIEMSGRTDRLEEWVTRSQLI